LGGCRRQKSKLKLRSIVLINRKCRMDVLTLTCCSLPYKNSMRGLVVIKGRRPDGTVDDYESDEESDDDDIVSNTGTEKTSRSSVTGSTSAQQPKKKISTKISPLLARLTLFHGCKLKNWDASVRNPTHHMHSFTETKVKKMCRQSKARKWAIYNQSHMSRTYPAGSRVDSSNYSPMLAWSTGCQLVALNFQTPDPPLKLNDGRFRENGNCGYVLKPSALMMKDDFSQTATPVKVSIRIVSGSCLPKPKGQRSGDCIDPYVKVSVYDVKNEEKDTCTTFSTTVVQNNGYFPIWFNNTGKNKFSFIIESGAVAMMHIEVYDKGDIGQSDEFIANVAIPISCLRQGYRNVQLFDTNNTRTGPFDFASLLIETKLRKVSGEI
jgi:phosphatidylinositol phospholipase C delta